MTLSTSPRKVVPLASGDDRQPARSTTPGSGITKRVFYCGVVVENPEIGRDLPQDVQELIASLGQPVGSEPHTGVAASNSDLNFDGNVGTDHTGQRQRANTDSSALAAVINELITTERSYVKRLQILKHDYADPLRKFSRSKDTVILPAYKATTIFGNIDNLLPVNEAFLADLEKMDTPDGAEIVGGIGDVALRHFKEVRGFEHYKQYYSNREDAQKMFESELAKKSSGFAGFIDHIKYASVDSRNRVGLRELLMDPVQRIPRYTLMFRTMIKHMAPGDPQRAALIEADEIASKVAMAETDEYTKRARIMHCLNATVDDFPPDLFSNSRRFIDCIDVEDMALDAVEGGVSALHCTLFLFDNKLMIVKRPGKGEKGGRELAGLDETEKTVKPGTRSKRMSCKGVIDITDVVVTDVGGADIHVYLEDPPQGQGDRWSGRPFRSLSIVQPPSPVNLNPTRTEVDKRRFLENLWHVQATYRTKAGQSIALWAKEQEVEARGGRITLARSYFNVYQRTAFLQETKKTKVVVHIDSLGSADPIPFGINGPPFVVIRVQPMAGELSRYVVSSTDPNEEDEETVIHTVRIPGRIVQTIHQFGLFKFRTGNNSRPSTPTANGRSRAAFFSLDAIPRSLFNSRPGSSRGGDLFNSGSLSSSHMRSKSSVSRSSTRTQTTTTGDGSFARFSHRSNSTATQATTVSIMDEESFLGSRSSRSRKLLKRGKSPGGSGSEAERESPSRIVSRSRSQSRTESEPEYSDVEDEDGSILRHIDNTDQSDLDLTRRLELARRNSQNQHGKPIPLMTLERPVKETIYEEEPPLPARPASRASRDADSRRSITPRPRSTTPTRGLESPPRRSRSSSRHSSERRPLGPRSPSPLPPKSPQPLSSTLPSMDADLGLEATLVEATATPSWTERAVSPLPRSKRQPFVPTENTDATPKPAVNGTSLPPSSVEPLSIKKKTSVRASVNGTPTPARRMFARNSPLFKASRIGSPRRVSPQVKSARLAASAQSSTAPNDQTHRLTHLLQTTKEDVESSRRAIKRIKLALDEVRSDKHHSSDETWESSSPEKGAPRTPQRGNAAMTKAAQERMEEMRQLIQKRQGEGTPRSRPRSIVAGTAPRSSDEIHSFVHSIEGVISGADKDLARAVSSHEILHNDFVLLSTELQERSSDLDKARIELQNTKRQCELVKSLLADATEEKEIMYEAFNEELEGMYRDANLPETEAWAALTNDIQRTKDARNTLTKENSHLKRRLAEAETQKEEWGALLRAHGLIP